MPKPTPRQRLTRTGLSAQFADLVLGEHAHQLAEQIRNDDTRCCSRATQNYFADLIDPEVQR